MPSVRDKLKALRSAARERELTPLAWWIGTGHHDDVVQALADADDVPVRMEGGHLSEIDGLEVKLLTETPDRLALWCEEGALDL